MNKPKLYVGCSLSGAPDSFVQEVADFKRAIASEDYDILEFVGKVGGTDNDVYEWDINECVRKCDAMLAICDLPGTGLGWELATAVSRGVPIVGVAQTKAHVSRLVMGAAEVESTMKFVRYEHLDEIIPVVMELMAATKNH